MAALSTPVNTVSRDNLMVLLRNNMLNTSLEINDQEVMETESPVRRLTDIKPIIKKLFHSPITSQTSDEHEERTFSTKEKRRKRKRREVLLGADEQIKMAYVKERNTDSPDGCAVMRRRVLISLFHNKEYCMDIGD